MVTAGARGESGSCPRVRDWHVGWRRIGPRVYHLRLTFIPNRIGSEFGRRVRYNIYRHVIIAARSLVAVYRYAEDIRFSTPKHCRNYRTRSDAICDDHSFYLVPQPSILTLHSVPYYSSE